MTTTDHYAVGFVIMACSLSLTFCVVKCLGQLEQSRCSYITTACCKVERDLSSPAHVIDVPAPVPGGGGGVIRHMHTEAALANMANYRSDDDDDDDDIDDNSPAASAATTVLSRRRTTAANAMTTAAVTPATVAVVL